MPTTYRTLTALSCSGIATLANENHTKSGSLEGDSDINDSTQDIGTSSELLWMGQITGGNIGLLELVNLDETNFVSVSFDNPCVPGTNTFKLNAGQSILLCNPSGALYAIADTATVKIRKRAVEA